LVWIGYPYYTLDWLDFITKGVENAARNLKNFKLYYIRFNRVAVDQINGQDAVKWREPGAPYPTLSKEEKKRNFPSNNSLAFSRHPCMTVI
jgi:hypothetical protein